jgi:hypothetical protein
MSAYYSSITLLKQQIISCNIPPLFTKDLDSPRRSLKDKRSFKKIPGFRGTRKLFSVFKRVRHV